MLVVGANYKVSLKNQSSFEVDFCNVLVANFLCVPFHNPFTLQLVPTIEENLFKSSNYIFCCPLYIIYHLSTSFNHQNVQWLVSTIRPNAQKTLPSRLTSVVSIFSFFIFLHCHIFSLFVMDTFVLLQLVDYLSFV